MDGDFFLLRISDQWPFDIPASCARRLSRHPRSTQRCNIVFTKASWTAEAEQDAAWNAGASVVWTVSAASGSCCFFIGFSAVSGGASFGMFRQMLEYKCARYGKELRVADRFFPSSKRCNGCGFTVAKLPLDVRNWTCPECGEVLDRDLNAAKNILQFASAAGKVVKTRGACVKPKVASATRRGGLRSENQPALCSA
jgi:ssDNA-binding Zn-finger/Zn-ribbon topoisomerase 1